MREFFITLVGIFMIFYGVVSIATPFFKPEKKRWMGNTYDFLTEKVFGKKKLNDFRNLFWGLICLILGISITVMYGIQLIK